MEKSYYIESNPSLMDCVAEVFSAVMEEEVTVQQASAILQMILSVVFVVFPVDIPIIFRIAGFVWMVVSFMRCKKEGILDKD